MGDTARVGAYALGEELGNGLYGKVIKGRHTALGRDVAIRFLPRSLARDRAYMQTWLKDAGAAARVFHPNVAALLDLGQCPQRGPYLVWEYAPGSPLEERAYPEGEALAVILSLCGALEAAAQRGLSHGRLGPDRVRIDEAGVVRLLNLGLARQKVMVGGEEYLAPEQWDDVTQATPATDVYGLGALLYRLLTGEAPPVSEEDDVPAPEGASPHVKRLVGSLTSRQVRRRYANPRSAGRDVQRILEGLAPLGPSRAEGSAELDLGAVRVPTALALPGPSPSRPPAAPPLRGAPSQEAPTPRPKPQPKPQPRPQPKPAAAEPRAAQPAPAAAKAESQPGKVRKTRINFYGDGFLLNKDEEAWLDTLVEAFDPAVIRGEEAEAEPKKEEPPTESRMILNEDMSRAYRVEKKLGEGGFGTVFKVRVEGDASFPGFAKPVPRVALKASRDEESILRERAIYSEPNPSIIKLMDHGTMEGSTGNRPFIVLERLYPHPFGLFGGEGGCRCDPATAIDTYVNLLDALHELHFRKKLPLVLCDIKPDNIMLRMGSDDLSVRQYMSRVAGRSYRPVFMDLGCAQHSGELRKVRGQVRQVLATPLYMPPESIPTKSKPGIVRDRMDVYALTLTFYQYLTGARPYEHEGIYELKGKARVQEIFSLKENRVSPIDMDAVAAIYGDDTDVFQEIFEGGLHPHPDHRVTAVQLLQLCKRRFRVEEVRPKPTAEEYRFDDPGGIHLAQQVYSPLDLATNLYLKPDYEHAPVKKMRLGRDKEDGSGPVTGRFARPTGLHKRPTGTARRPTGVHKRPTGSFQRSDLEHPTGRWRKPASPDERPSGRWRKPKADDRPSGRWRSSDEG